MQLAEVQLTFWLCIQAFPTRTSSFGLQSRRGKEPFIHRWRHSTQQSWPAMKEIITIIVNKLRELHHLMPIYKLRELVKWPLPPVRVKRDSDLREWCPCSRSEVVPAWSRVSWLLSNRRKDSKASWGHPCPSWHASSAPCPRLRRATLACLNMLVNSLWDVWVRILELSAGQASTIKIASIAVLLKHLLVT